MAVTQENATICQKCGKTVDDSNFCPYCGEVLTQGDLSTEDIASAPVPETVSSPPSKTVWQRLPLWAKILSFVLSFVLIVLAAFSPVIVDSISKAQREAAQEKQWAAEEAEKQAAEKLKQKQRQELVDLWNTYAAHDSNGPTKGKQLTVDMAGDRVDFGSGWVEFDAYEGYISLYYHAEQLISEADISALGAIFSNEAGAQRLARELQSYNASIRDRKERPHGADYVGFKTDFDTKSILELEFSDPYARYLNSSSTEAYYSNQVSDESYFSIAQQLISPNLKVPSSAQYSDMKIEEHDKQGRRLITMAVDAENSFGAMVRNYYAIIVQKADTQGNFTYHTSFAVQQYSATQKDNVIAVMKQLNGWDLPFEAYEYDGPDIAEEPQQASPSDSDSSKFPYAIRATGNEVVYHGPGTNYDFGGTLSPHNYTIVAESEGEGAELWGRLSGGAGWISLDNVLPPDPEPENTNLRIPTVKYENGNAVYQGNNNYFSGSIDPRDKLKPTPDYIMDNSASESASPTQDPSASASAMPTYEPLPSLPYVIRATGEMPIYSGPGVNYDYNGSMPSGAYTIVEESEGQGAALWGKLKSGAGWIALDNVS